MTEESTFRRSDHLCKRIEPYLTNDKSYYVFNWRTGKRVSGPFFKWQDGNDWIEEQVDVEQRRSPSDTGRGSPDRGIPVPHAEGSQ